MQAIKLFDNIIGCVLWAKQQNIASFDHYLRIKDLTVLPLHESPISTVLCR
ncbi:MAG: hypothetical protein ACI9RO_000801 [Alteromonas macleodii]|jgi:hypothetical protein